LLFALEQLDLEIDNVKFYTDSKVVLGYISNETRRFFVYVGNRVERIRKFSTPKQWNCVPTDCNPADSATRTLQAHATRLRNAIVRTSLIQSENRSRRCAPISHLGSDTVSGFALLTAGIRQGKPLKGSTIANLNLFLDEHGIIRVGAVLRY
jgi:hypothetical protein